MKKLLLAIVSKVHPDRLYAANSPEIRHVNQTSLQQLNSKLTTIRQFVKGQSRQKLDSLLAPTVFSFWFTTNKASLSIPGLELCRHTIPSFAPQWSSKLSVDRLSARLYKSSLAEDYVRDIWNIGLIDLAKNLKIFDETGLSPWNVQRLAITRRLETIMPFTEQERGITISLRSIFEQELRDTHSSIDSNRNACSSAVLLEAERMLEFFQKNRLLFFSRQLSELQTAEAMVRIWQNLDILQYHRWRHRPVLVGPNDFQLKPDGFLVIPFDFEVTDFLQRLTVEKFDVRDDRD
jgi:hypothetical protein